MDDVFPNWGRLQHGDGVNIVLQTLLVSQDDILCKTVSMPPMKVLVKGAIPSTLGATFTLVHAKVIEVFPLPILEIGQATGVFSLPHCTSAKLAKVVDMCCGIGLFSSVAEQFSMTTVAGVDINAKWQTMFESSHPGAKFLTGDVADVGVIQSLLQDDVFYSWVVAGVSCQPHSKAGDKKGMQDDRAASLPRVLHTSWLMQSPLIILECVADIIKDAAVQSLLRQFCQTTGCCLTQKILKLSDVWPTARTRWFAILTSPLIGPVHLDDLPSQLSRKTISEVMPFIKKWDSKDEDQIHLSLYELAKFYQFATGGIESQYIKMNGMLATCLHSAGNQLYACRCGCRGPFTLERLANKGLFATLIPLDETVYHMNQHMRNCRYLHPVEMMILQGGNPQACYDPDLRLCLAAIGQCVSPIQACWVFAHAVNAIQALTCAPQCQPISKLREHMDRVLQSRDAIWIPSTVLPVPEQHQLFEVKDESTNTTVLFRAAIPTTIGMLKSAEAALQGVDPMDVVVTDSQGMVLANTQACNECQSIVMPALVPNQPKFICDLPCPCAEWKVDATMIDAEVSPTLPFVATESHKDDQGAALAEIPLSGLLNLLCPHLNSTQEVGHMLKQKISLTTRTMILQHQNTAWADDEIRFFLDQCAAQGPTAMSLFVWDPLILSCVVRHGKFHLLSSYAEWMPAAATILTAVSIEQHWYPIVWQWQNGALLCFTCGHAGNFSMAVHALHHSLCQVLGCESTAVQHYPILFPVQKCCGAMVHAFMDFVVYSKGLPKTMDELVALHEECRAKFAENLCPFTPRPWIWGNGDSSWQVTLGVLLQEHGVASDDISARIALLVDKLGRDQLSKAVESPAPWRELKWLANSQVPAVQIIRPMELQQALDRKVQMGGAVGSRAQKKQSKGKAGGKGKQSTQQIDPASLRLEHGLFECGQNIPVGQVDFAHLSPTSSGVILCTSVQAAPYLKSAKQVSAGGLAMIVIDMREVVNAGPLIAEPVRVPVVCQANMEPALVDGVMFQLGAMPVRRRDAPDKFELITVSSCVAKIMIYRDQAEGSWDQIVAHPLKHIFSRIPCLQPCADPTCEGHCEAWHPNENYQLQEPILELWGKQYIRHNFQPAPPASADLFQVMIRIPQCLQTQVQTYSGISGVYLEPRGLNGKQPSDRFQVVWVPRASFDELRVMKQTIGGVIGIARLGQKFGLRCAVEKASEVYALVKPGSAYLPQGRKQQYLLGPVPYGTIKLSISQMIESINWKARPVQPVPAGQHVQGLMWKVQAVEPPGQTLIHTANGDIVISKLADEVFEKPLKPSIIAAQSTVSLCTDSAGSSQIDPLQVSDPWAHAVRNGQIQTAKAPVAGDPFEHLQKQVLEAVLSKLPHNMEIDGGNRQDTARVESLEQKVNELSNGQQQLHSMMVEQHQKHDVQVAQIQQHQAHLESSVQEHTMQLGSFQQQFRAQLEQQQSHLDSLFGQQMTRLEEMLGGCKKPRVD